MKYVLGFLFSGINKDAVSLIRKAKPEWQEGKLNGLGGKIEAGETPRQAMSREFFEEAGVDIEPGLWTAVTRIVFETASMWPFDEMHVFAYHAKQRPPVLIPKTFEMPCYYETMVVPTRRDVIDNLCWLIPMARWALENKSPKALDLHLGIV